MTSGTKFIGGHGDVTLGVLSIKGADLAKRLYFMQVGYGRGLLAPSHAAVLLKAGAPKGVLCNAVRLLSRAKEGSGGNGCGGHPWQASRQKGADPRTVEGAPPPSRLPQVLVPHGRTPACFPHGATEQRPSHSWSLLQNAEGAGLAPFDCWLALRGLRTMALRMERSASNCAALAAFLVAHPLVSAYHARPCTCKKLAA